MLPRPPRISARPSEQPTGRAFPSYHTPHTMAEFVDGAAPGIYD